MRDGEAPCPALGEDRDASALRPAAVMGAAASAHSAAAQPHTLAQCRVALTAALSERRAMEQVLALVRIGTWEADLATGRVRWSDELCRMHGAEPGYVPTLEQTVDYYSPESRGPMAEALRVATEDGGAWNVELTLLTVEGRRFRARAFGRVEFAEGEAVRLHGAVQYLGDWAPR